MRLFRQSTDTPSTKPLPKTLAELRTEAVLCWLAGAGVVVGLALIIAETGEPRLAFLAFGAVILFLRGWWLWQDTQRMAEHLPPRPERKPSHWLRIWWWMRSRPPRVKRVPEPFRRVKVGDDDEVLMPRQPAEMRQAAEPFVVTWGRNNGYTKSDVYYIVCRAASIGLSDRAWQFGDQRVVLPSGAQLSRDGFRAVQAYLVEHKHATAKPSYALLATPEAILETL